MSLLTIKVEKKTSRVQLGMVENLEKSGKNIKEIIKHCCELIKPKRNYSDEKLKIVEFVNRPYRLPTADRKRGITDIHNKQQLTCP